MLGLIHFPMWGGMFTKPNPNATEEEYYTADYTKEEQEQGLHKSIFKWVSSAGQLLLLAMPSGLPTYGWSCNASH